MESQKNKVRKRTMETYLKRRRYFADFENVKLKDMSFKSYTKSWDIGYDEIELETSMNTNETTLLKYRGNSL